MSYLTYLSPPRGGHRRAYNPELRARRQLVARLYEDAIRFEGGVLLWSDSELWHGAYGPSAFAQNHHIYGYSLGLNRDSFTALCSSKTDTAEALFRQGIFSVERNRLSSFDAISLSEGGPNTRGLDRRIPSHHYPVVIAPDRVEGGRHVRRVDSPSDTRAVVDELLTIDPVLTWSPFFEFSEYRVVVLDGDPLLVFEKVRAEGEWRHNLGQGAQPLTIDMNAPEVSDIVALACDSVDVLRGTFAAVDIAVPMNGSGPRVLEINPDVVLGHYAAHSEVNRLRAANVYSAAFRYAFKQG